MHAICEAMVMSKTVWKKRESTVSKVEMGRLRMKAAVPLAAVAQPIRQPGQEQLPLGVGVK